MGAEQRSGFIALHRKVLDSALFALKGDHWKVATVILLWANWHDGTWFDGRGEVTIPRGDLVSSIPKIAAAAGVTERIARRAIANLERIQFVKKRSSRSDSFTWLSVVNYDAYQDLDSGTVGERSERGRSAVGARSTSEQGNKGTRNILSGNSQGNGTNPQANAGDQQDLFGHVVALPPHGSHVAAVTRRVVDYLNRKAGRRLGADPYRELVRKVLEAGHTEREINLVTWWASEFEWPKGADDRAKRLHPNCLFPMRKPNGWRGFPQYLDLAREKYRELQGRDHNPHESERAESDAS